MNKSFVGLAELERRRQMVIWQLSIAIDSDIVQKKENRLKELTQQIKSLTP